MRGPFAQVPPEVILDHRLGAPHLRVLLALLSFRRRDSESVWPSREALAERTGYRPSSITRYTSQLVDLGWIIKTDGRGRSRSCHYKIKVAYQATFYDQPYTSEKVAYQATISLPESPESTKENNEVDADRPKTLQNEKEADQATFSAPSADKTRPTRPLKPGLLGDLEESKNRTTKTPLVTPLSEKPKTAHPPLRPQARQILQFLNDKTNRDFQPVAANLDLLVARLKEGYTPGKLRQIVACKCQQWLKDDKMRQYLRPATLFARLNCAQYRGELIPESQLPDDPDEDSTGGTI